MSYETSHHAPSRALAIILLGALAVFAAPNVNAAAGLTITIGQQANDPLLSKQNYLVETSTPFAWNITTGSARSVIAIIDTGVDLNHPDLRDNIWVNAGEIPGDGIDNDNNGYIDDINGWDFVNEIPDPKPKFSDGFSNVAMQHGTLIAGIAAAVGNNNLGVAGVSWHTKIMSLRALNNRGEGDAANVARAIDYAIAKKVNVINLSFVGDTDSGALHSAINRAYAAGIVVVAAAGNDNEGNHGVNLDVQPLYPVCYTDHEATVIGVGALDDNNRKASFSHYGGCIDISVPGSNFFTTQMVSYERLGFDTYYGGGWSGTSLSAGIVSGAAGLLTSINSKFTPDDVLHFMKLGCDPIYENDPFQTYKLGCGKLNVEKAVKAAVDTLRQAVTNPDISIQNGVSIVVTDRNGKRPLMFFTPEGKKTGEFYPYYPYKVPFTVARSLAGDDKIITAAGQGGGPHIRIFKHDSTPIGGFFAYDSKFRGGVYAAMGDVDGDGEEEIVTTPGPGMAPIVKIFDQRGKEKGEFLANNKNFNYGLKVVLADTDGDGMLDIIVTPVTGNSSEVRIFNSKGIPRGQFFAYSKSIVGGINIEAADLNNDGTAEIIVSPAGQGAVGEIKIFSADGKLQKTFAAYDKKFRGGVNLAIVDVNHDGKPEIIIAPAFNGGPQVRIFSADGTPYRQFFALEPTVTTGLRIGTTN